MSTKETEMAEVLGRHPPRTVLATMTRVAVFTLLTTSGCGSALESPPDLESAPGTDETATDAGAAP
jgi:hypothetical protein